MASTEEVFIQSGDVRIHCRTSGQGPLLILLHGFPDNSETWDTLVPELEKTYTVVRPTMRGFPPSDVPQGDGAYALANTIGDLGAVMMHFQSPKAIFVGHDFGGAAVQILALFKPELVKGLVLINAPIVPRLHELVNFDEEQQKLAAYTIKYMEYKEGDDKDVEAKTSLIPDAERRKAIQQYLIDSPMHGMMSLYRQNYPGPPYGEKKDTSSMKFQVPTLILWGTNDGYFSNKHLDGLTNTFLGPTRLVTYTGLSHWPWYEQPKKVLADIESWVLTLSD